MSSPRDRLDRRGDFFRAALVGSALVPPVLLPVAWLFAGLLLDQMPCFLGTARHVWPLPQRKTHLGSWSPTSRHV